MKKVGLQCRNVRLAYGATAVLKDISLDIAPGEFFALLGPSGSGKSTLLRLIAGFAQQQHGQVLVDGQDVGALPPWRRNIGMVFQNYALWPHMTVWDNVAFGLVERKLPKPALRSRVQAALELVGLAAYAQRRPGQLSGGQQQRVALARTIVIEPQVLLLDEPLSNLDKSLRVQMRQELLALQRRLGLTTIFVTHDQEEAMTTADRMAVLDHGVLQQVGTPAALYDAPVNAFVAGFVGTMNFLPGRVLARESDGLTVDVDGVGVLRLPPDTAVPATETLLLSCRPHALRLAVAGGMRSTGGDCPVWLSGTVHAGEFLGAIVRYHVHLGSHILAVDQPHHSAAARLTPGTRVSVGVEPAQLRLYAG